MTSNPCRVMVPFVAAVLCPLALADDWSNSGGNAGRNGRTTESGPGAADVLWSGGRPSIIAWQPVIEGGRVFMVRQTGFLPAAAPNDSPVVAQDLDTGAELWFKHLPHAAGDWTAWVAGVKDGRVFASRGGNGASVSAPLYALDAATGGVLWDSDDLIDAGPYDGVVFADDGDPFVGSFQDIWRINAQDGTTVWHATRTCSVSSSCGGALGPGGAAFYVADAAVGGHVIKRFNAATGAFEYAGPAMTGFTLQNTPLVGPDGSIYLSRTQNNVATDFFYAFADSGAAITQKWFVPARWTVVSEFAVGADGSVYMLAPGTVVRRLHPDTGAIVNESAPIVSDFNAQPRLATDAVGRVYLSNGSFMNGRFYCFNADLTERWNTPVPNSNIGGPAIGEAGTLVVAGIGTSVRAFRVEPCYPDCNASGTLTVADFGCFQGKYVLGDLYADCNATGSLTLADFGCFQGKYVLGCP
ncbi:MAG: PQQ-binding-like beta-propeller repeat protein [Phycisphaerales bacterium]